MRRREDQPVAIGDILQSLAKRVRRVDLAVIEEVRGLWPTLVDDVIAQRCRPEMVKNGVLLVAVPSGAFAQRILEDTDAILAGLAVLGDRAPHSLRPLVSPGH
jgi:predicted nucleic acid-binding Zn ribbon protein